MTLCNLDIASIGRFYRGLSSFATPSSLLTRAALRGLFAVKAFAIRLTT